MKKAHDRHFHLAANVLEGEIDGSSDKRGFANPIQDRVDSLEVGRVLKSLKLDGQFKFR
jgi:hypothetical protein